MLTVEFPSGQRLDFDSPEALARAVQSIRAGKPIVVRDREGRLSRGRVGAGRRGLSASHGAAPSHGGCAVLRASLGSSVDGSPPLTLRGLCASPSLSSPRAASGKANQSAPVAIPWRTERRLREASFARSASRRRPFGVMTA